MRGDGCHGLGFSVRTRLRVSARVRVSGILVPVFMPLELAEVLGV